MEHQPLTLVQLNQLVADAIHAATPSEGYWLTAEISELHVNHGHCYLSFVQKSDTDDNHLLAKADGHIWARTWKLLGAYFQRQTQRPLSAGMQVLVRVVPTFHTLYGYALNVLDIDPVYTLGDMARHRQEILQKLQEEGIAELNKQLPLPRLLQRIAIISAPTAAGYQDFYRQLHDNTYGFAFRTQLFPAILQGDQVEASVFAALSAIADESEQWDAVVIIRGGGATTDLSGFDTLLLAEAVAQFPLPVITGIGHERDDTLIDLVAHTRVKTPTAAAEFILLHQANEYALLTTLSRRLTAGMGEHIFHARTHLLQLTSKLPSLAMGRTTSGHLTLERLSHQLHTTMLQQIERGRHQLAVVDSKVKSADPVRLLRLGYSITRLDGHALTSVASLRPGQQLTTTLADGTLTSVVQNTINTPQP